MISTLQAPQSDLARPNGSEQPELSYRCARYAPSRLTEGLAPEGCHAVYATARDGSVVGRLLWDPEDGEVYWVGVEKPVRRRGIATALWRLAHQETDANDWICPLHSNLLMPDGQAWIASL